MEIENLAGVWPNIAINPANGLPYKCDRCAEMYEREIEDLQNFKNALLDEYAELAEKLDNANDNIQYLRKVCQTQADSFAAIENENCALRSKLNRIRELAERLDDWTRNA